VVPRGDLEPNPERLSDTGIDAVPMSTHRLPVLPVPLGEALLSAPHLAFLGEPGAGKSTALQFIGLSFAGKTADDHLGIRETRYPVLIILQAVTKSLQDEKIVLKDILVGEVRQRLNCEPEEARDLLESWHEAKQLLVLLDGLDEVPAAQRSAVFRKIENFLRSPYGHQARVVLTSRLAGFTSLAGMVEFTVQPFEDPEKEAQPFLKSWLAALKPEWTQKEAEIRAAELRKQMQGRPAMRSVLNNPLLLRLSAETYARTGEIARNRAALYVRHVEEMWTRAEKQRNALAEQKDVALEALEALAWHLQQGGGNDKATLCGVLETNKTHGEAKALLELLREKTGLIARLPGEQEAYVFTHQTLREYFVARHLQRAWQAHPRRTFAFLRPRLHLAEWREPLSMIAGLLSETQAVHLIRRVYHAQSSYERRLRRDLLLAVHLAVEGGRYESVREWLLPKLTAALRGRYGDVCRAAAAALGNTGDRAAVNDLRATLHDDFYLMHNVVAYALGKIGDPVAVDDLLRVALSGSTSMAREAAAQVLGEISPPASMLGLVAALCDEDKDACTVFVETLGRRGAEAAPTLIAVLRDCSYWISKAAAQALGGIGVIAVPNLIAVLRDVGDGGARRAAAEALGAIGDSSAVEALRVALQDDNVDVRVTAAESLGAISSPDAVNDLIATLRDEEWRVRRSAAEALGKIGLDAVPTLRDTLHNKDWMSREGATNALGKIGAKEAINDLCAVLQDETRQGGREAVAEALGNIGDPAAVNELCITLQHEIKSIRAAAARALGNIGDPAAVAKLRPLLQDKDNDVREAAAGALGKIGDPAIMDDLADALKDENRVMQKTAAEALAAIRTPAAVDALVDVLIIALQDEDWRMQGVVTEALRKMGSTAVPALIAVLRGENNDARWAVGKALGGIRDPTAVQNLVIALRDENSDVRHIAMETLESIGPIAVPALITVMQDENVVAREAAAWILTKFDDPAAVSTLIDDPRDRKFLWEDRRWGWMIEHRADLKRHLSLLKPPAESSKRRILLGKLRRLRHMVARRGPFDVLDVVLERESAIRVAASPWQDPLQPPPWRVWGGRLGLGALALLVVGLGALVGTLVSPARKVLEEQLLPFFQAQPWWAAVLFIVVGAALSAILGLALEKLRHKR